MANPILSSPPCIPEYIGGDVGWDEGFGLSISYGLEESAACDGLTDCVWKFGFGSSFNSHPQSGQNLIFISNFFPQYWQKLTIFYHQLKKKILSI